MQDETAETEIIIDHATSAQIFLFGCYSQSRLNQLANLIRVTELIESGCMIQRRITRRLLVSYYTSLGGTYGELPFS